jgi:stalled ribosome rescue protein Dom34
MITEKNHKLLTSQLFVTDCTKKGLASMYTILQKKWWDRVRQKIKVLTNSEIAQIFIKHNAATKVLTFPTTDIGHPSFS